jgi:hypothetical protein
MVDGDGASNLPAVASSRVVYESELIGVTGVS